ncbi:hypothetical protein BU23DRAFT_506140 [Bimuria novae-zelandiae CBS 107.79]|uniref:DUF4211 domain-containing protein n=1 Tax=Bimuria novae-zelandiae CBS 107.79 TaxID=1447943 RepID=A0A6A5VC26_9PLEO|nr:hypothetical protein BU23DRAFT_506140 [Bimuria novae-zelandiae CBS 107.79]
MAPKRSLARTRQTKLNFSPASNASLRFGRAAFVVSSDSDDGPSPSRPAKRQILEQETRRGMELGMPVSQNKRGMFGSSDNEIIIPSGDSSDTRVDRDEVPVALSSKKRGKQARKAVISDDEEEEEVQPKPRERKHWRRCSLDDESEESSAGEGTVVRRKDIRRRNNNTGNSDKQEMPPNRKTRRVAKRAPAPAESSPESASGDEVTANLQKEKWSQKKSTVDSNGKKAQRSKKDGSRSKRKAAILAESSEADTDDIVLVTPRKSAQRRQKLTSDSEEEGVARKKQSTRRKKRQASTPEAESEADEQKEQSGSEADELKEDLAFLQSSPLGLGSTQSRAKTGREKALEALKKKRAINSDPPSSSAGRKKPIVVDSDSESDLKIIPEVRDEEVSEAEQSSETDVEDYGATAHEALYGNEDDNDFINDDDAPIGVPAEHALPLQFSSLRNAKPRDLFKYAIEWMVQKKINPAFASDDEIYEMTFRKLNDEVSSLASSKYHSSVWTPEFTRAIRARPEIMISNIDPRMRAVMEPHCEACNRKTHPASFELSFTGKPYDKETLEPLAANASDSDSDSDSDSSDASSLDSEEESNGEKPTYDDRGERIPPESKAFTLGSTCKANAQVAHTLYHWRYHLNSWVLDYLTRQGHCTAEQIVARDKWSVRKRQKFANKVVDEMEKGGEIKRLHHMYRDQVNWAIETDNEYRKGWGRRM